mgnify:CR=1 FL=1
MEKERKIKCDCGTEFKEQLTEVDGIMTKGMVCDKCGFTTFTKAQAKEFAKLQELHRIIDKKRKVIKIGNSKGITLPEELNLETGQMVKTEALTTKSFIVKILAKNH